MLSIKQSDKVFNSYLEQQYRIGNLTLAASEEPSQVKLPEGFIISAWSPKGQELTLEENQDRNWALQTELIKQKQSFRKILQVEKTRAWVEDAFLIEGINRTKARSLAKKFKQAAFIQLKGNTATVFETNSTRKQTINLSIIPTQYGCPAKKNGQDNNDYCKPHGYWTTSQAIKALSIWKENLTIVNSRLGCNLCNNVTTHPNNLVRPTKSEYIPTIQVTNRHSLAQWVRI